MAPLPHRDLRHPWRRYQVDGYDEGIVHSYEQRLKTIWGRAVNRALFTSSRMEELFGLRTPLVRKFMLEFFSTCGMSDNGMRLDVEEMAEAGFGAYWSSSESVIPDKGDLRDYWMEISSDRDFLGAAPFYVFIQDPVRRLCHRMTAYSIFGRGQAPEKGLRGLSVVVSELLVIDLHELGRLNICSRFGDTWAWVAPGPERQQATMASAFRAAEDAPAADKGA
ncbi:hypothetical protein Tco_0307508 [Tanacetum coccineum]